MAEDVTMKQEIFCQAYVDTVGNGTQAALAAFDIEGKETLMIAEKDRTDEQKRVADKAYRIASSMATEYLRKLSVIKRIDEILDERGFTDEIVKQEHFKMIKNADYATRMRAIESYYKLKGKIIDKQDLTTNGKELPPVLVKFIDANAKDNRGSD